jgi:hypothetical protein
MGRLIMTLSTYLSSVKLCTYSNSVITKFKQGLLRAEGTKRRDRGDKQRGQSEERQRETKKGETKWRDIGRGTEGKRQGKRQREEIED